MRMRSTFEILARFPTLLRSLENLSPGSMLLSVATASLSMRQDLSEVSVAEEKAVEDCCSGERTEKALGSWKNAEPREAARATSARRRRVEERAIWGE